MNSSLLSDTIKLVVNSAKMMISVLHKELWYKVEKLKYNKSISEE